MPDIHAVNYPYEDGRPDHTHKYLWGPVCNILDSEYGSKIFDLGCGNGAFTRHLRGQGYEVMGVDPSCAAIAESKKEDSTVPVEIGSAYDPLKERYGQYPLLVSLEVIEHVYYPRKFAKCVEEMLESGGVAVISTPYHGYLKNLALAVTGSMDRHFTALWDDGHIKFWSIDTLTRLFAEQNLTLQKVLRVGRVPIFAKSMILVFKKQ